MKSSKTKSKKEKKEKKEKKRIRATSPVVSNKSSAFSIKFSDGTEIKFDSTEKAMIFLAALVVVLMIIIVQLIPTFPVNVGVS